MNLDFATLTISQFGSIQGLTLDLSQFDPGLYFVRGRNRVEQGLGSNGAGKSTLWAAMCWCLFGRTPDGLQGTDMRPWGGTTMATTVSLVINGRTLTRSHTPNKLTLDGKVVSQEDVDKLVGMSLDTFLHTVLLGQGLPLFFDLQPREKLELFTTVLELDRWDDYSRRASDLVSELSAKHSQLVGESDGLAARIAGEEELRTKVQASLDGWEQDRRKRIEGMHKERDELQQRHERIAKERDLADLALDEAGVKHKLAVIDLQKADESLRTLSEQVRDKERERELVREAINELQEELDDLPDDCPTCGRPFDDTKRVAYKRKLMKSLETNRRKLERVSDYDRLDSDLSAMLTAHTELEKAVRDYSGQMAGAQVRLDHARKIVDQLESQLKYLKEAETRFEDEINPHRATLQQLRRSIDKLKGESKDLAERIAGVLARIERNQFWVKEFKAVKLHLIDEVLQELELTTNHMLMDIGLTDWSVQYSIERETKAGTRTRALHVSILSPRNRGPVKWQSWSGGEGQRLRIIGTLALSEVLLAHAGVGVDLEILDEPTHGLSEEGVRDLVEFLADRARMIGRRTFLVDHHAIESARFRAVLQVERDESGTRIIHR